MSGESFTYEDGTTAPDDTVTIPGTVTATVDPGGTVTRLTFTPSAGAAGYFGPLALCENDDLDVNDDAGPFWRALQQYLRAGFGIDWTE